MVHNLIRAYGLLSHMRLVPPKLASEDSLLSFHSRNYIEFLKKVNESSDLEKYEEDQLEFGLGMHLFYNWVIYT
jgi:histone deacetylase 8